MGGAGWAVGRGWAQGSQPDVKSFALQDPLGGREGRWERRSCLPVAVLDILENIHIHLFWG